MSTEINGINSNQIGAIDTTNVDNLDQVSTSQESTIAQDSVELSQEAQNLQRLEQRILEMPDVDMEQVNTIKQSISEGHYEVNIENLADNMMNFEDALFAFED